MIKPKLLDLFCGAGGASMGYHRAGFEVVGVDITPQPHYPFEFHQTDALTFPLDEFDVIHASPPCQAFSKAQKLQKNNHPNLIEPIRTRLLKNNKPFVIENVVGSPLVNPIMLCGGMFGLTTYRHRLFESNMQLEVPNHPIHKNKTARLGRPPKEHEFIHVVGHFSNIEYAKKAMGIDWMIQKELAQAIPPSYTEYIGNQIYKRIVHMAELLIVTCLACKDEFVAGRNRPLDPSENPTFNAEAKTFLCDDCLGANLGNTLADVVYH